MFFLFCFFMFSSLEKLVKLLHSSHRFCSNSEYISCLIFIYIQCDTHLIYFCYKGRKTGQK